MRAVKSVTIDSERRVIITFLDGSTETLYPNLICCDAEALRDIIKELLEAKADAVVQTISNVTVATFEDGADEALIRKLLVSIDPIQEGSGDPSPDNVRPISGRTGLSVVRAGKNLLNIDDIEDHGYYSVNGVFSVSSTYNLYKIPVKPNTNYIISGNFSGIITYWDANLNFLFGVNQGSGFSKTFTTPDNCAYIRRSILISAIDGTQMLELGSTATDYEPYKGSTYSVNWEAEAGTVYGGTLDVVSGKLVVDKAITKFSNNSWVYDASNSRMRTMIANIVINKYSVRAVPLYCSMAPCVTDGRSLANVPNNSVYGSGGSSRYVYFKTEDYTSEDEFLSIYGGADLVYEIDNPIEIQLDAQDITTLLGINNIWADSCNILELEYVADTKLYIGESQSGTVGTGKQTITKPEIQHVSDKTVEDVTGTEEKETQEETEDERGE